MSASDKSAPAVTKPFASYVIFVLVAPVIASFFSTLLSNWAWTLPVISSKAFNSSVVTSIPSNTFTSAAVAVTSVTFAKWMLGISASERSAPPVTKPLAS